MSRLHIRKYLGNSLAIIIEIQIKQALADIFAFIGIDIAQRSINDDFAIVNGQGEHR